MIEQYEKQYIAEERFNKMDFKNTACSVGSVGSLLFDKHLYSKGFISKGIRNAYHPESYFFNPKTTEVIGIHYGIKWNKQERLFYITISGINYELPATQEDLDLFDSGNLKILFS